MPLPPRAGRRHSPLRRAPAWLLVAGTLRVPDEGGSTPAALADAEIGVPQVTGTVTTANGVAIPNATVSIERRSGNAAPYAYQPVAVLPAGSVSAQVNSVQTAADGTYSFSAPAPTGATTYIIGAVANGYETQYFNNKTVKDLADSFTFSAPGTATDFSPRLAAVSGAISGTVTRQDVLNAQKRMI